MSWEVVSLHSLHTARPVNYSLVSNTRTGCQLPQKFESARQVQKAFDGESNIFLVIPNLTDPQYLQREQVLGNGYCSSLSKAVLVWSSLQWLLTFSSTRLGRRRDIRTTPVSLMPQLSLIHNLCTDSEFP